jgi:hypothetical protein
VRRVKSRSAWLRRGVPHTQLHLVYPICTIAFYMGNFRCPIRGGGV